MADTAGNGPKTALDEFERFAVYILNDDYTTWEFYIRILIAVFNKNIDESDAIAHDIHNKGKGLCGMFTHEIAETKASIVVKLARKDGFPLRCSIEEE